MNVPIICVTGQHRFTVATVTTDLRCVACGSEDLDLDESVKTASATKCKFCDKAPVIEARWMASDGNSVVETNYYCQEHRNSSLNWSGDVEESVVKTSKTAAGVRQIVYRGTSHDQDDNYSEPDRYLLERLVGKYVTLRLFNEYGVAADYETGRITSTENLANGDIEWERDGAGYAHPMEVAYIYSIERLEEPVEVGQPRLFGQRQASFETDPEMGLIEDTTTITQHARCSTCFTEHTVTSTDPAQPMPACPSCGAETLTVAGGTLARRRTAKAVNEETHDFVAPLYYCRNCGWDKPSAEDEWVPPCSTVSDGFGDPKISRRRTAAEVMPAGSVRISPRPDKDGRIDVVQVFGPTTSNTVWQGRDVAVARDFAETAVAEAKSDYPECADARVYDYTQKTASRRTALVEREGFDVWGHDGGGGYIKCNRCNIQGQDHSSDSTMEQAMIYHDAAQHGYVGPDSPTYDLLGNRLKASRRKATFDNPTPGCDQVSQLQSEAYAEFGLQGLGRDEDRAKVIAYIKAKIQEQGLTFTQEDLDCMEDCNVHAGAAAAEQAMGKTGSLDASFASLIRREAKIAKIAEIAAGIRQTNPGMPPATARRVAEQTVAKYPKIVRQAEVGTCDWCSRTGELTPVEGERLCWPCTNSYLDQKAQEGVRVIEDGRETVYRPGMAVPRAWNYR